MKRLQTLMAVPLMAGLLFVTGCDNDDEPLPAGPTNTPTVGLPTATSTETAVPATATHTGTPTVPEATSTPTVPPPTSTPTPRIFAGEYSATLPLGEGVDGLLTFTVAADNSASGTLDTGSSGAAIIPVTGSVDAEGNFSLSGEGVSLTGTLPINGAPGAVQGTVDGVETSGTISRIEPPTPTQVPATNTPTETPTLDVPIEAICGDGVTDAAAGEKCDDGNNYGGDGCAANCTLEEDINLNLGSAAQTQSRATVQTISFPISLPLTGRVVITYGEAREQASVGVDGFTSFAPNEIPLATVIDKNQVDGEGFIDPISVPGVACACLRGVELRTCGGRRLLPGNVTADNATPCNDDPNVCNDNPDGPCIPAFGPGVNAGGRVGCDDTLEDLDYLVVADSFTGDTDYEASGGRVALGVQNFSFTAIGTILGTCDFDESNPDKGPDGIPCTDDDPESVRGVASVNVQTTGMAQATVQNANSAFGSNIEDGRMCGAIPCATKVTGAAKSCEELATGNASGLCLGSAFAALAQPTLGDIVTPVLFCGL